MQSSFARGGSPFSVGELSPIAPQGNDSKDRAYYRRRLDSLLYDDSAVISKSPKKVTQDRYFKMLIKLGLGALNSAIIVQDSEGYESVSSKDGSMPFSVDGSFFGLSPDRSSLSDGHETVIKSPIKNPYKSGLSMLLTPDGALKNRIKALAEVGKDLINNSFGEKDDSITDSLKRDRAENLLIAAYEDRKRRNPTTSVVSPSKVGISCLRYAISP